MHQAENYELESPLRWIDVCNICFASLESTNAYLGRSSVTRGAFLAVIVLLH